MNIPYIDGLRGRRIPLKAAGRRVMMFVGGVAVAVVFTLAAVSGVGALSIVGSAHDLSYGSPAAVRAQNPQDDKICKFCHTPHNASPAVPLWNHQLSAAGYSLPQGQAPGDPWFPLLNAPPEPDLDSKLCLSCHDGTVAVGDVYTGFIPVTGLEVTADGRLSAANPANLTTDLSGNHPISVPYNLDLYNDKFGCSGTTYRLKLPTDPAVVPLLKNTLHTYIQGSGTQSSASAEPGVQCTSCHDPHDPEYPKFLRGFNLGAGHDQNNITNALCQSCHDPCP